MSNECCCAVCAGSSVTAHSSMPRCKLTCSLPTPHLSDLCCSEYSASVQQSHRTNGMRAAGRAKAFYLAAFPQSDLKSCKRKSTDCCMSKHTSTAVGAEQSLLWREKPLQGKDGGVTQCRIPPSVYKYCLQTGLGEPPIAEITPHTC